MLKEQDILWMSIPLRYSDYNLIKKKYKILSNKKKKKLKPVDIKNHKTQTAIKKMTKNKKKT